ncbi:MAG: hypothetical protein ALAOOOJD_02815 [bacterium]|nr:hypothetical protein [bacterium]
MLQKINLKLVIPVTLLVVAGLAIAKELYKVPNPLLEFIGATFGVCSIVFWGLQRPGRNSAVTQLTIWLLSCSVVTVATLVAVYRIDHAGWLWFKLTGYNETLPENLADRLKLTAVDLVARHRLFAIEAQDAAQLHIAKGAYTIDETIVVPAGFTVTIAPGAVLQFGAGCSFISYSPLIARGTESEPIIFTAKNPWLKWGVVGVVRASQAVFEHVRFEQGRQALVNDIDFPGTLSLVETVAEVTHSEFVDLYGKDGAQVHGGEVVFRYNAFRNTFKDGVDFDGGAGEISHNRFENCGDEAIDLGEDSQVQVSDNVIIGSKDAPKKEEAKLSEKTANIDH